jgi:hypothetical protein
VTLDLGVEKLTKRIWIFEVVTALLLVGYLLGLFFIWLVGPPNTDPWTLGSFVLLVPFMVVLFGLSHLYGIPLILFIISGLVTLYGIRADKPVIAYQGVVLVLGLWFGGLLYALTHIEEWF